jgi:hypothetical protein
MLASARGPYCVRHDRAGERIISVLEYEAIRRGEHDYDLVFDTAAPSPRGGCWVWRRGARGPVIGSVARAGAAHLAAIILRRPLLVRVQELVDIRPGAGASLVSVRKMVERARGDLDGGEQRAIHTIADADPALVGFRFVPPDDLRWAMLVPLPVVRC